MLGIKLLLIMNICFLQGYTALTPSIHRHRPTQTCHLGWTGGCQRALSDGGGWVIIFGTVCISVFPCRKSGLSHLLSSCWVIRECLFRSPYFSFTEQNMILWPTMAHSLTSQWSANEVLLTTFFTHNSFSAPLICAFVTFCLFYMRANWNFFALVQISDIETL